MPDRPRPGDGAERWLEETVDEKAGFRLALSAERILEERHSGAQDLVLFENRRFGKVLMLDGAVQLTGADEFAYHEMLAHVPLFAHGRARRVLIVGGGDCGLAEEVLKHPEVEALTQVEIDPSVVAFAQEHFPELTGPVLADSRFELVIDDAAVRLAKWGESGERRFDAILVDSTDPQGPGAVLFTRGFYADCRRCLAPSGVLATQSGVPFLQPEVLAGSAAHLRTLFADVGCFLTVVPTYAGGHMALGWATDDAALRKQPAEVLAERHRAAGGFETRYWTPEVQAAAFVLPRFIAALLEGEAERDAGTR